MKKSEFKKLIREEVRKSINESGKVVTDKALTQHFGKTIKQIVDITEGEEDGIKILFTDGSELSLYASANEPHSSATLVFS